MKEQHPDAVTHHQVLAGASRAAVLDFLRRNGGGVTVDQAADAVGLHANTVRSHLDLLVSRGYATRRPEPRRGPGRPRMLYEATAVPDDGMNYRLLAEVLVRYLGETAPKPAEAAAAAGRQWVDSRREEKVPGGDAGEADEALQRVLRMLADAGFAPELAESGSSIRLHHCPFRELAESRPDVVCGAHLGILQGALAEFGAPVEATRLLPLVEPDLCIATLEARDETRSEARDESGPA